MSFLDRYASVLSQYDVLGAFWVNIQLTFWAAIGSFVLGCLLALMRISPIARACAASARPTCSCCATRR
jgi:glutamate transport system permease protein